MAVSENSPQNVLGGDVHVAFRPVRAPAFAAIIKLVGEHDMATSEDVTDALASISGNILVDLSDCSFIDSTAIGAMVRAARRLERDGQFLEIVAPPASTAVAQTLHLVGVRSVIPVYPAV